MEPGTTARLEPLHLCLRTRLMPLSAACARAATRASRQEIKMQLLCLLLHGRELVRTRQDPAGHLFSPFPSDVLGTSTVAIRRLNTPPPLPSLPSSSTTRLNRNPNNFAVFETCMTGRRIPPACGWNNGVRVPPRHVLPSGILVPVGVRSGNLQPFRGDGGVHGLLGRLRLPGELDHARGVSGVPLLSGRFRHRDYLPERHIWLEGERKLR